jgi:hypothetical protein
MVQTVNSHAALGCRARASITIMQRSSTKLEQTFCKRDELEVYNLKGEPTVPSQFECHLKIIGFWKLTGMWQTRLPFEYYAEKAERKPSKLGTMSA